MSCTIANHDASGIFQLGATQWRGAGGLVLKPTTRISCSYPCDGGTTDGQMCCGGCHPERSYPADDLKGMLEAQLDKTDHRCTGEYNEVVVPSEFWVAHLPGVIEAFILGQGGNDRARAAHAAFLREYGLTAAQVPLLHSCC